MFISQNLIFGILMYGEKLKKIREYLSVTQNNMAELLQVSNRSYTSYERNENNPPYSILIMLCKKYNINLNWFIADIGEMFNGKELKYKNCQEQMKQIVLDILKEKGLSEKAD